MILFRKVHKIVHCCSFCINFYISIHWKTWWIRSLRTSWILNPSNMEYLSDFGWSTIRSSWGMNTTTGKKPVVHISGIIRWQSFWNNCISHNLHDPLSHLPSFIMTLKKKICPSAARSIKKVLNGSSLVNLRLKRVYNISDSEALTPDTMSSPPRFWTSAFTLLQMLSWWQYRAILWR